MYWKSGGTVAGKGDKKKTVLLVANREEGGSRWTGRAIREKKEKGRPP